MQDDLFTYLPLYMAIKLNVDMFFTHRYDWSTLTAYAGGTSPSNGEPFKILDACIHDFRAEVGENGFSLVNNIALFYLDRPLNFTEDVMPVCPPDSSNNYANRKTISSGFGAVDRNGRV